MARCLGGYGRITITEDAHHTRSHTKDVGAAVTGFGFQLCSTFVYPIRWAVITPQDTERSLSEIRAAICHLYSDDNSDDMIYGETHDEVANGSARAPQEISSSNTKRWCAKKQATLAEKIVFSAASVPMMFHGQELLEGVTLLVMMLARMWLEISTDVVRENGACDGIQFHRTISIWPHIVLKCSQDSILEPRRC